MPLKHNQSKSVFNPPIQLHQPFLNFNGRLRMFEVCRNSSLVLSIISNIRRDEFFGSFFEEKKNTKIMIKENLHFTTQNFIYRNKKQNHYL